MRVRNRAMLLTGAGLVLGALAVMIGTKAAAEEGRARTEVVRPAAAEEGKMPAFTVGPACTSCHKSGSVQREATCLVRQVGQ